MGQDVVDTLYVEDGFYLPTVVYFVGKEWWMFIRSLKLFPSKFFLWAVAIDFNGLIFHDFLVFCMHFLFNFCANELWLK